LSSDLIAALVTVALGAVGIGLGWRRNLRERKAGSNLVEQAL
jgi:hypothetical protein